MQNTTYILREMSPILLQIYSNAFRSQAKFGRGNEAAKSGEL